MFYSTPPSSNFIFSCVSLPSNVDRRAEISVIDGNPPAVCSIIFESDPAPLGPVQSSPNMEEPSYEGNPYGGKSYESGAPILVLVPVNGAARRATENVLNRYYQYLDAEQFPRGLWINLSDPSKSTCTLGRTHTDIHLPDTRTSKGSALISDLHASFEFIPETGAVLLWDHSENANVEPFTPTHVSGHSWTVKFRSHTRRSVVVARGINSYVAFGKDKWYQFEIQWQSEAMYGFNKEQPYTLGPGQPRTKRYVELQKLGGGAYGTVYSAMDTTTGLLIAVKRFHSLSGKYLTFATREVANLRKKELRQHVRYYSSPSFRTKEAESWNSHTFSAFSTLLAAERRKIGVRFLCPCKEEA